MENSEIKFGNGNIAAVGALAGLGIAVGVPWVVLVYGQILGQAMITGIVIVALIMGSSISIVSAFFGLVMPRHVGGPFGDPKQWAAWGKQWRDWERGGGHRRHGRGRGWDGPEDLEEEVEAPRRRRRGGR